MIFGEPVIHIRRVKVGQSPGHNQPIYEEIVQPEIHGASFQSVDTVEPGGTGNRFRVVTEGILYVPPGTDVIALDKFKIREKVYEVQGNPMGETSAFTGLQAHIPVQLKRVTG